MLTHRVPYPPDRGDRIRAYHLLRAIASRHEVTLAAVADEPMSEATRAELKRYAAALIVAPARPMRQRMAAARALLTGGALTPAAFYDASLVGQLVQRHRDRPFDTVLTYCTGMIGVAGAVLDANPTARPRHVLDLVDVDSQKWAGFADRTRGPMRWVYAAEADRLRRVEAGEVVPFDAAALISSAEVERYRRSVTQKHTPVVVGNGVDLERFYPAASRAEHPTIVFTGVLSYKPNVDAVTWFARRVMPRVRAARPDCVFKIVGKSPGPMVYALGELPGVEVVGPVVEPADHLRAAAVAVAPMRIAPGVQNKVLEAMACGLPVVCSSAAASGIDAKPGRDFLVADTEAHVARQCVRLLTDCALGQTIGSAARLRIEQAYRWSAAAEPMLGLLEPLEPATAELQSPACSTNATPANNPPT